MNPWTEYWKGGNLESCINTKPGKAGELSEFWVRLAKGLARETQVLDLACGNGAVSKLMCEANPSIFVTGVDLADIEVSKFRAEGSQVAHLRLLGNTPLEDLPFDDASFDCIVSQFGLEYSDLCRSLKELTRVARPGAKLSFLMHHQESSILRSNQKKIPEIKVLLAPGGLLVAVHAFIEKKISFEVLKNKVRAYFDTDLVKSEQISGQVVRGINMIDAMHENSPSQALALLFNIQKKCKASLSACSS